MRIVYCALCGRIQLHSTSVVVVDCWSILAVDLIRIFPVFHLAVAGELPSLVAVMDEDNIEPTLDFDNL